MTKRILTTAFKYGLGIVLLAYVIWRNWTAPPGSSGVGLSDALQRPVQVVPLALATVLCLVSVLLTFVRWYFLVRAQELPFTLPNALRLGLIGYFLNSFLPGAVGGDIIKAAFIAREQSRRTVAVATVLIDRAIGLWGLFWLVALLGSGFWLAGNEPLHRERNLQIILLGSLAVVAGTVLVWGLLGFLPERRAHRFAGRLERIPKVGHSFAEFWRAIWMYRRRPRSVALALGLALIAHVGFVLTFYFAAQTFLAPDELAEIPSLAEHFLLVPIGMTIQALFPSPGGVGGGEWGYGKLYTLVGKPESYGVLGSLAQRVITWSLGLVGYIVYLRMKPALRTIGEERGPGPALAQTVGTDTLTGR